MTTTFASLRNLNVGAKKGKDSKMVSNFMIQENFHVLEHCLLENAAVTANAVSAANAIAFDLGLINFENEKDLFLKPAQVSESQIHYLL